MIDQDKSPAEIERHAEDVRAQVATTADDLRDRLSPGKLVDEVTHYLKNSDGALSLSNLQTQVRDNPMALALVGTGLAWLIFGSGKRSDNRPPRSNTYPRDRTVLDDDPYLDDPYTASGGHPDAGYPDRFSGTASNDLGEPGKSYTEAALDGASDTLESARSVAGDAIDGAKSAVSGAYRGVRRGAAGLGDRIAATSHDVSDGVAGMSHRIGSGGRHAATSVRHTFDDLLDREPLIIGAISVAVGAALGAMAPSTRFEDEHFGAASDQLKQSAADAAKKGLAEAKDVAMTGYEAGKKAAEDNGALSGASSLAGKVEKVAGAAVRAAETEAAAKTGKSGESTGGV